MSNYTARVYTPYSGLVAAHNAVRLGGVNELSLRELSDPSSFTAEQVTSGPIYNYFVLGLIVPAVIMIVAYVIWMFSLCCAKICCKGCCGKTPALIFFTVSGFISILGWVLALVGNGETTAGFMQMVNAIVVVQDFGNMVIELALGAVGLAENMEAAANTMSIECSSNNIEFPLTDVLGSLSEVKNVAGPDSELQTTINEYNNYIDNYVSTIVQYLEWREIAFGVVFGVMLGLTLLFVFSTILRVMDHTPKICESPARCSSKLSSTCVFIFGILIMLIIWIFLLICHIIVTFGADICVPSPNYTINRIVAEVSGLDVTDACLDPDYREGAGGTLCYYQTCNGTNIFETFSEPIADNADAAKETVDDFFTEKEAMETSSPACVAARANFNAQNAVIADRVRDIVNVVTCEKINPVYAAVLYDGICNGLFGGLYLTYATLIIGSVCLMLAMSVFRIFDFGAYRDGQLPTAIYADEAEEVDNGPRGGQGQAAVYNGYEKNP